MLNRHFQLISMVLAKFVEENNPKIEFFVNYKNQMSMLCKHCHIYLLSYNLFK